MGGDFRSHGGDWKVEIVNSDNQIYVNRIPLSPNRPPTSYRIAAAPAHAPEPEPATNYYSYYSSSSSSSPPRNFKDPEIQRRKRVNKYKVYAVEGRVKASLRNGVRWIKSTCSRIVHGY